jgi:hypothetical protein
MNEVAAGRTADREQFLEVAQRNPDLGSHLARTEIWISKAILDDMRLNSLSV